MLTIDYSTFIIFVPKAYTQFVSINPSTGLELRQVNLTTFAQDIADLQDDAEGAWASTAFEYTAPVSVGGVQLAPVVVILSPYTVEFEDGQYAVNLSGANTNVQDVSIVNQVSIRPNNSAGLTFSDVINEQSYQDASIWVDSQDGLAGTQFPRGTPTDEVNNLADAVIIANRLGLNKFHLRGTVNAVSNIGINRFEMLGTSPTEAIIVAASNFEINGCAFERLAIRGSIVGRGSFKDCSLGKTTNLTGVQGIFDNCALAGHITLDAATTEPIMFKDCVSAIAGSSKPLLDCNGVVTGINFSRYAGGLSVTNFNNAAGTMTLDMASSDVVINSTTCTAGELVIRGISRVTDENGVLLPSGENVINGGLTLKNYAVNKELLDAMNIKLTELHQMDGLDDANPVSITPTQKTSGTIDITIGGDGENIATLTRQP
jgi:hypothetical protein